MTSLDFASLHFSMISSTLYFLLMQLNYHFPYPLFKSDFLQRRFPNTSAGNWFQCWIVLFTKEYFTISVLCLLLLIILSWSALLRFKITWYDIKKKWDPQWMESTCTLFNIKLTKRFKVKFCTNYEKFIHIVPNFREISLSHISQPTRKYTLTTHICTRTHIHVNTIHT